MWKKRFPKVGKGDERRGVGSKARECRRGVNAAAQNDRLVHNSYMAGRASLTNSQSSSLDDASHGLIVTHKTTDMVPRNGTAFNLLDEHFRESLLDKLVLCNTERQCNGAQSSSTGIDHSQTQGGVCPKRCLGNFFALPKS